MLSVSQRKNAFFKVNADTGKYHCFGCGAAGDVIDFICLRHGISFVEAKAYLGIGNEKRQREHRAMRVKRAREAKLRLLFRERYHDLTDTYRTYTALINRIRDWRDMLRCSVLLQRIAWIEYALDELQSMATGREPLDLSDPLVKEVLKDEHL